MCYFVCQMFARRRPTVRVARRKDSGGVELRVTHERKMRRYGLGGDMTCTAGQWNEDAQRYKPTMPGAAGKNAVIGKLEMITSGIIDRLMLDDEGFTWQRFDALYSNAGRDVDVVQYLEMIRDEMIAAERHGNATLYAYAARVVLRFTPKRPLPFRELNVATLKKMDAMLRSNGAHDGGVSQFMRTLRAAVNRAIKEGLMPADAYPFATPRRHGYEMSLLRAKNVSRALSPEELERMKAFDAKAHPELAWAWHFFMFSYYARGMNGIDMAYLPRPKSLGGRITYKRRKTIRKSERVITIPVRGQLAVHLEAIANTSGTWMLPIFDSYHKTVQQQRNRWHKVLGQWNDALKEIGELLEISGLTSYVARHTYATRLKRMGVDIAKISEGMAHASVKTTEPYMAQFEDAVLDATDELL